VKVDASAAPQRHRRPPLYRQRYTSGTGVTTIMLVCATT
jgi:hypothetical protein